jgi:putative DNA primase/helicase
MKRQTCDIEHSSIGDEGVYLRIQQLQNGLLQLTDATTAERMLKEFGKDIRYIAPWKKWIVWYDDYWRVDDSGALIHTKGLEIVRNIYAEIYKTADYRERMEIEKYAIKSESTRSRENFVRGARYIIPLNAMVNDLDRDPWLLNVENGTLDLRMGELLQHHKLKLAESQKCR